MTSWIAIDSQRLREVLAIAVGVAIFVFGLLYMIVSDRKGPRP